MKRAAIIGCGTIFQVHLPIIVANPEIELCAVCDNNPAVQEKLCIRDSYDGLLEVDLSKVQPMIAMPFQPSNTYTIEELNANLTDILADVEKDVYKRQG